MYTYRQPFPALTLQYVGTTMRIEFETDPDCAVAPPSTVSGISYTPGSEIYLSLPDGWFGDFVFYRESDSQWLGRGPYDFARGLYLAITPQITEQLVELAVGGAVVIPALPLDMSEWLVLWAEFYDLDQPQDGVQVILKIQGAPPFTADGERFERDGLYVFTSGAALTVGPPPLTGQPDTRTVFAAKPGWCWIVVPKSSALRDRYGANNLAYRLDSVGAPVERREAINGRVVRLEVGGNLLTVLLAE